jgi:RNA polymerase sigma-70 factor (ECF subfamily)
MNTDPADARIAALLTQREWVRSLARALVRDESAADDLEQETWLAALANPPTWDESPRGWLASVLRRRAARRARTGARVAKRERAAARPEAVPSAADVVAEAEQHRRVVDAVFALDETQRTAVLLRFYEGLPPREIATKTGAPVETVRARVRRGLAQVRERFDREHAGDRRAWRAALAPLLAGPGLVPVSGPGAVGSAASAASRTGVAGGAAGAAGVLAMTSTTTKVVMVAAALLALGWAGWTLWPAEARPPRPPATERAAAAPDGEQRPTLAAPPPRASQPAPTEPTAAAAPRGPGLTIVGQDGGKPILAARALVLTADGRRVEGTADASGFVAFAGEGGRARAVWARAPGFVPTRRSDVDLGAGVTIPLARGREVRLRFVDKGGATLSAEHVAARFQAGGGQPRVEWVWPEAFAPPSLADFLASRIDGGAAWRLDTALGAGGETTGLADGLPAEGARLLVVLPGGAPWLSEPIAAGAEEVRVFLDNTTKIQLRLLADEDGTPLPGATVRVYAEFGDDALFLGGPEQAADGEGRVTFTLPMPEARKRGPSLLVEALGRAVWIGAAATAAWRPDQPADVRVPRVATVEGHAWTPAGEPAAGWEVTYWLRGFVLRVPVAADGAFRVKGITSWDLSTLGESQKKGRLMLRDEKGGGPHATANVVVKPGGTVTADLGTPRSVARTGFRGRILAGTRPVPGQFVSVAPGEGGMPDAKRGFAVTDVEGRFELRDIAPGSWRLAVLLGNPHVSDDFVLQARAATVVRAGEMTTLDLVLPEGAVRVRVVDGATDKPIPGAAAAVRPERPEAAKDAVPGFQGTLGSSAVLDAEGRARLEGLPLGEPLVVEARADGYTEGRVTGTLAGTGDGAPEVVVRLAKK